MALIRHAPEIRTLIIARPDRIGDVVISTSCLTPLREKFPDARIYFVAAEQMRPLLEGHPLLTGYISLNSDLTSEFRRLAPSAIVYLHPNEDCYEAAYRAGIPLRIGYPMRFKKRLLTNPVIDRRKGGLQHEAAYNFDLLNVLEVPLPRAFKTEVRISESHLATLKKLLPWKLETTRFAVINPTAHSKFARWPASRFLEVANRLEKEFNLHPVIIGGDASDSLNRRDAFVNLAGKTNLGELACLLKHASVMVSNDTGPGHLAAAVGCSLVTLFGRNAPIYGATRWRPLSDKVVVIAHPLRARRFEQRESHWQRCFAAISVEEVMSGVAQALKF